MGSNLKWLDSLMIRAIISCDGNATMAGIQRFVNEFKVANRIPDAVCTPIRQRAGLYSSFSRLRDAGLMQQDSITLTEEGLEFYMGLGSDWRSWPRRIPVLDGRLLMEEAKYMEEFSGK